MDLEMETAHYVLSHKYFFLHLVGLIQILYRTITPPGPNGPDPPPAGSLRLPDIQGIFECEKVNVVVIDGKEYMECEWCPRPPLGQTLRKRKNATKMLYHVCGVSGGGIAICQGVIAPEHQRRYNDLRQSKIVAAERKILANGHLAGEINDTQEKTVSAITSRRGANDVTINSLAAASSAKGDPSQPCVPIFQGLTINRKRPPENFDPDCQIVEDRYAESTAATSVSSITSSYSGGANSIKRGKVSRQTTIFGGNKPDPAAKAEMDVALADLIHSKMLPFIFSECPKIMKVLEIARRLPLDYIPPGRHTISGKLLDGLYSQNWKDNMSSLLNDARKYGVSVFGDGATIVKMPLINLLAASPGNPFAMLDILDCSGHCATGMFLS